MAAMLRVKHQKEIHKEEPSNEVLQPLEDYFDGLPKVPTLYSLSIRKMIVSGVAIVPGSMPKKLEKAIKLIKEAPGTYKKEYHESTIIGDEDTELKYFNVPDEVTVLYNNDLEEWCLKKPNTVLSIKTMIMTKPMEVGENYVKKTYYTVEWFEFLKC